MKRARTGIPLSAHHPQPWDALLLCMAALLLVSVARIHTLLPGLSALRPGLMLAGLATVLYLTSGRGRRSLKHLKHPLAASMSFLVVWAGIGAMTALYITSSIDTLLGSFLSTLVLTLLLAACVRSSDDVRRLLMTLAVGGIVFSLMVALPAVSRSGVRAGGYDPNYSAMFIVLTIPLILYFLIAERRATLKVLFAAGLIVCTIGMIRSDSRGGFLALMAVVGYALVFMRGVKPSWRVGTVAMAVAVMGFAGSDSYWERMHSINDPEDYNHISPTGRKAIWERARGYIAENPMFGVGISNFSVAESRHPMIAASIERGRGFKYSDSHSIWYKTATELGIPGFIAFVMMFLIAFRHLRRMVMRARASPSDPLLQQHAGMASALIGSLIAIAVAGTFLSNAYSPMIWSVFGLVLGLLKVSHWETGFESASRQPLVPSRWRRCVERPPHLGVPATPPAHAAHD
jgi:O-antigen ligase